MPKQTKTLATLARHDPADRERCSYCKIEEDIHLLDGVLTKRGNDTGKLACIACYPTKDGSAWCPTGENNIARSIAPSLKPLYDAFLQRERRKRAAIARLTAATNAVNLMRQARSALRKAGAGNAADYVQRALKSAEGAVRHARRLVGEAQRAASMAA
jgi:hypothetical protein